MTEPVYILTAQLDADSFAWLDGLRRVHFPSARNVLSAHLTLFHRLDTAQVARLGRLPLPAAPIPLRFAGVMLLGFGNAIGVEAPQLERLRADVKAALGDNLSRQDDQRWKPHVTVQNKVTAEAARALHVCLARDFKDRVGTAEGLAVWEYLGGPWRPVRQLTFA